MKHPARSWTLWFNLLATLFGAAEASLHLLQPVLGATTYPVLLFTVTIINAGLRFKTTQALSMRAPPPGGIDVG